MFSRAGVRWAYEGFLAVDAPEDVDVGIFLVTHHHERHVAAARRAGRVVMNPLEYSMATDLESYEIRQGGAETCRRRLEAFGLCGATPRICL